MPANYQILVRKEIEKEGDNVLKLVGILPSDRKIVHSTCESHQKGLLELFQHTLTQELLAAKLTKYQCLITFEELM